MLADLLKNILDTDLEETWENKRTATPVRAFAIRLHEVGCSLRETTMILAELGVERSHGAVWNWVHRLADSERDPRRRRRRGSLLTRPLSELTANSLGCTLQLTLILC